jgi:Bifunctional DNA primase/polymerase, N-terminal/AAA domain
MNIMLQAALQYERFGWSVIPLREREKTPIGSWSEFQKRRASPEEIRQWWTERPNANLGIVTGAVSGLSVIDLDGVAGVKNGLALGYASAVTSLTGNGRQLFYKFTEGTCNSASKIAEGVDVRGEGGYVVAPPSVHPNGKRYQFLTSVTSVEQLKPLTVCAPTGIAKPLDTSAEHWMTEALSGLREGNRDSTFARVVGKLHSGGLDPTAIRSLLRPHADRCGFADLDKVIASISRYARPDNQIGETAGENIETFLQEGKPVEWICKNIIAKGAIGFVAGLPETMKTWLTMDLAVECARGGGTWLGLFPVSPARVLFVDQERFKGETQRRFKNIIGAKGIKAADLKGSLFVRCGTTTRLDLEASFRAFRSELLELRPDLVIVDSFATFHTRNDNDRQAIQPVLESIKQLRAEIGCSFVFIDHESKAVFQDKELDEAPSAFRMVGSVGKAAAAEFVLTVRRYDDHTSTVWHTKSTLSQTVPCFNTTLVDTPTGIKIEGIHP